MSLGFRAVPYRKSPGHFIQKIKIMRLKLTCQLIILLLFLSFGQIMAQQSLSGKVSSEEGPVPFANVLLHTIADSSLAKFTVTNDDGSFVLENLEPGRYFLAIQYLGLSDYSSEPIDLTPGTETLNIGEIAMTTATSELAEVVVVERMPLVRVEPDKITLNVENTINSVGSNAAEILRRSPGLRIDANGEITIDGKKGVMVYVDGQLVNVGGTANASTLEGVQSADIKSIEVLSNPSAKYDAAGSAGVINIILKKSTIRGFNNAVNSTLSYGYTPKFYGAYNFNLRNEKLNFYGNAGYYTGKTEGVQTTLREQLFNGVPTTYDQRSVRIGDADNINMKAGLDIFLSEQSTLGFFVRGNYNDTPETTEGIGSIYTREGTVDSVLTSRNNRFPKVNNTNYNINYQLFGAGSNQSSLTILIDYLDYNSQEDNFQPNTYTSPTGEVLSIRNFASNATRDIELLSMKIDYEQQALGGKIGIGLKGSRVNSGNDFDFFNVQNDVEMLDLDRSRFFSYKESIYAAYINYNVGIKNFYFNLGLRAENTNGDGLLIPDTGANENFDIDYFNLFPNILAGYRINDQEELKFNFSRRVDRPRYENLNPFVVVLDELTYSSGNPFLMPQFSNNFQLSYRYKTIFTSLNYSKTNNYMAQVLEATDDLRSFQTFKNIADVDALSLNVSTSFNIGKIWNSRVNAGLVYSGYRGPVNDAFLDVNNTSFSISNEHNFRFGGGWDAQLFGYYNGARVDGIFEMRPLWSVDFALSKGIWNNAATLRLAVTDIFKSWRNRALIDYSGLDLDGTITWESRQVKLSFNYSFGNNKLKQPQQKQSSSSEEQRRLQ